MLATAARRALVVAAWLLALGAAGCEAPVHGRAPRSWTLFDLFPAVAASQTIAKGPTFPAGIPADGLLAAPGAELFDHRKGAWAAAALKPSLAFADGKAGAYYTTEVWSDVDEIWVQPMYILVTAWNEKAPKDNRLKDEATGKPANPIFSFGLWRNEGKSLFYSPYWQVFYAVVPAGTPLDKYKSQKQILDDKLPLHAGPGKICSLSPHEDVVLAIPEGATTPVRPWFGDEITSPVEGEGWVDGRAKSVWYWDFGNDRFTWNAARVVKETPLYLFFKRDESGAPVYLGLRNVGGSAGGSAPGGRPNFGALWRFHSVLLPATAAVLVPSKYAQLRDDTTKLWPNVPAVDPAIEARPDIDDHTLKVLLKPDCLTDPTKFPAGCDFLDSQAAVERLIPAASIKRTELSASCPLMYLGGKVPL